MYILSKNIIFYKHRMRRNKIWIWILNPVYLDSKRRRKRTLTPCFKTLKINTLGEKSIFWKNTLPKIIKHWLNSLQWSCNGIAVVLQWSCNGLAMVLQWSCNGLAMVLQWSCYGINSRSISIKFDFGLVKNIFSFCSSLSILKLVFQSLLSY